jgi:hypothetical protein
VTLPSVPALRFDALLPRPLLLILDLFPGCSHLVDSSFTYSSYQCRQTEVRHSLKRETTCLQQGKETIELNDPKEQGTALQKARHANSAPISQVSFKNSNTCHESQPAPTPACGTTSTTFARVPTLSCPFSSHTQSTQTISLPLAQMILMLSP